MRQKLIPVDITLPPTDEGKDIFDYVSEYYPLEESDYFRFGSGIRYTIPVVLPEEAITLIVLRWPNLIELDIDPELHSDDFVRFSCEAKVDDKVVCIRSGKLDK